MNFKNAIAVVCKERIAFLALVVSILSLLLSLLNSAEMWASPDIRALITEEARASVEGDTDKAASLYCPDALVRNWGSYEPNAHPPLESWQGIDAIRNRYKKIPRFTRLVHVDVNVLEIRFLAGTARAVSSTDGTMATGIAVASVNGDIWEFRKVNRIPFLPWTGEWKIASFTYDCKK